MPTYETPGVFVEEVPSSPASVAQVDTAVPAFIGYTEKGPTTPVRITSMVEYESNFGGPSEDVVVTLHGDTNQFSSVFTSAFQFKLYYSMQLYFGNGGGPCYVVSAATYATAILSNKNQIVAALDQLEQEDEPTMLVLTDGTSLSTIDYYDSIDLALAQCNDLGDRITLVDTLGSDYSDLRGTNGVGANNLKYGAAYFPNLVTTLSYPDTAVVFALNTGDTNNMFNGLNLAEARDLAQKTTGNGPEVAKVITGIVNGVDAERARNPIVLPPSGAMAGVLATVDRDRGVWKAPANVAVSMVTAPEVDVTSDEQAIYNIDTTGGKSINVIRTFPDKGHLVWGARTLAGNDNEWRYLPVRRLFNTVEESVRKATAFFVFEPNDGNTWTRLRAMVENYLLSLWREGALAGATPEQAFFVKAGLGSTMTADDILDGQLHVEIGMAAVRPAEFIVLRFSHIMQQN